MLFSDARGGQTRVADQPVSFYPTGFAAAALALGLRNTRVTFHGSGGRDVFTFAAGAHQSHIANVVV